MSTFDLDNNFDLKVALKEKYFSHNKTFIYNAFGNFLNIQNLTENNVYEKCIENSKFNCIYNIETFIIANENNNDWKLYLKIYNNGDEVITTEAAFINKINFLGIDKNAKFFKNHKQIISCDLIRNSVKRVKKISAYKKFEKKFNVFQLVFQKIKLRIKEELQMICS